MASDNIVSFEAMFDNQGPIDKNLFKEEIVKDLRSNMQVIDVQDDGESLYVKAVDPHASQGYNVFNTAEQFQEWLDQSLFEPTQDQMEEALNGSGS